MKNYSFLAAMLLSASMAICSTENLENQENINKKTPFPWVGLPKDFQLRTLSFVGLNELKAIMLFSNDEYETSKTAIADKVKTIILDEIIPQIPVLKSIEEQIIAQVYKLESVEEMYKFLNVLEIIGNYPVPRAALEFSKTCADFQINKVIKCITLNKSEIIANHRKNTEGRPHGIVRNGVEVMDDKFNEDMNYLGAFAWQLAAGYASKETVEQRKNMIEEKAASLQSKIHLYMQWADLSAEEIKARSDFIIETLIPLLEKEEYLKDSYFEKAAVIKYCKGLSSDQLKKRIGAIEEHKAVILSGITHTVGRQHLIRSCLSLTAAQLAERIDAIKAHQKALFPQDIQENRRVGIMNNCLKLTPEQLDKVVSLGRFFDEKIKEDQSGLSIQLHHILLNEINNLVAFSNFTEQDIRDQVSLFKDQKERIISKAQRDNQLFLDNNINNCISNIINKNIFLKINQIKSLSFIIKDATDLINGSFLGDNYFMEDETFDSIRNLCAKLKPEEIQERYKLLMDNKETLLGQSGKPRKKYSNYLMIIKEVMPLEIEQIKSVLPLLVPSAETMKRPIEDHDAIFPSLTHRMGVVGLIKIVRACKNLTSSDIEDRVQAILKNQEILKLQHMNNDDKVSIILKCLKLKSTQLEARLAAIEDNQDVFFIKEDQKDKGEDYMITSNAPDYKKALNEYLDFHPQIIRAKAAALRAEKASQNTPAK